MTQEQADKLRKLIEKQLTTRRDRDKAITEDNEASEELRIYINALVRNNA